MARVTIEDCLKHVDNRFELVLKAAARARRLELGEADPMVEVDNDKPTVIALREIAAGLDITPKPVDAIVEAERALFADPAEMSARASSDAAEPSNPLDKIEAIDTLAADTPVSSTGGADISAALSVDTSDVKEAADIPDVKEAADTSDVIEVADTPDVKEAADTSDVIEVADTPDVKEAADTSDVAEATDTLDADPATTDSNDDAVVADSSDKVDPEKESE